MTAPGSSWILWKVDPGWGHTIGVRPNVSPICGSYNDQILRYITGGAFLNIRGRKVAAALWSNWIWFKVDLLLDHKIGRLR